MSNRAKIKEEYLNNNAFCKKVKCDYFYRSNWSILIKEDTKFHYNDICYRCYSTRTKTSVVCPKAVNIIWKSQLYDIDFTEAILCDAICEKE